MKSEIKTLPFSRTESAAINARYQKVHDPLQMVNYQLLEKSYLLRIGDNLFRSFSVPMTKSFSRIVMFLSSKKKQLQSFVRSVSRHPPVFRFYFKAINY